MDSKFDSDLSYLGRFNKQSLLTRLSKLKEKEGSITKDELSSDSDEDNETQEFILDKNADSQKEMSISGKKKKKESKKEKDRHQLSTELNPDLNLNYYIDTDILKVNAGLKDLGLKNVSTKSIGNQDELMKKSVIIPGFEKLEAVPPYFESSKKLKQKRKEERDKTKGRNWFDLPATEMTDEIKNDLLVLKMRNALDPKHFYKKNDLKALPKYFQVGRVIDSPADFYNSRIPKKERKRTMVEELLVDAEFQQYKKKKAAEIYTYRDKTRKAYHSLNRQGKKKKSNSPTD